MSETSTITITKTADGWKFFARLIAGSAAYTAEAYEENPQIAEGLANWYLSRGYRPGNEETEQAIEKLRSDQ